MERFRPVREEGRRPGAERSAPPRGGVLLFLGSERSGTTLVQNTLVRHYDVAPGNESQWVIRAWRRLRGRPLRSRRAQERFLRWIFADWYFANQANYHGVHFDHEAFIQEGDFAYPQFVRQVFGHIAASHGRRWVLNKTCVYCRNIPVVEEVFDRPRVAHLVRDGRDVGLSLLKTVSWGPKNPYAAGRYWADHVDGIQSHAATLGDRYLELKYEELLDDAAGAFETLTRFYGIFEEERHAELVAALQIRRGNREKWRGAFSASELEKLEQGMGPALVRNGYAPATQAASRPLSRPRAIGYLAHSAIVSRVGLYPLWFRGIRTVNRIVGLSPTLKARFQRSAFFQQHFNWNKVLQRRGKFY